MTSDFFSLSERPVRESANSWTGDRAFNKRSGPKKVPLSRNQAIQICATAPTSTIASCSVREKDRGPRGLPWCTPLSPLKMASRQKIQLYAVRDHRSQGYNFGAWSLVWRRMASRLTQLKALVTSTWRKAYQASGVWDCTTKHHQFNESADRPPPRDRSNSARVVWLLNGTRVPEVRKRANSEGKHPAAARFINARNARKSRASSSGALQTLASFK